MPYDLPEGYFDSLLASLTKEVGKQPRRWLAYIAIAASFTMGIAAGSWFLRGDAQSDFSQEDCIVFSDEMTNTIMYEEDMWYADAATEDDLIEYLIYTGTEIDELY